MVRDWSLALTWVLFSLSLHAVAGCVTAAELSPQSLVEAHESAIAAIRLIDLTYEQGVESVRGVASSQQPVSCRWTADVLARRERFRFKDYYRDEVTKSGPYPGYREVSRNGTEYRILEQWDWNRTQKLTPFEQRGVFAMIDPTLGESLQYRRLSPSKQLLWSFYLSSGKHFSLRELWMLAGNSHVEGGHVLCGLAVQRLVLRDIKPAVVGLDDPQAIPELDIDIDPISMMVLRQVERFGNVLAKDAKNQQRSTFETRHEVVKVRPLAGGILLPVRIEHIARLNDKETSKCWTQIVDAQINEPLAEDALTFRFPEYALVKHLPAVNGLNKIELWGADDRPIKEIKSDLG